MSVFPKTDGWYKSNQNLIRFLCRNWQIDSRIYKEMLNNNNNNNKKLNYPWKIVGGHTLLVHKTYYKATVHYQ